MKTKIGMSFGLSLMLALGVFATMLALGMFNTALVEAGHNTTGSTNLTVTSVTATPNDPGDPVKMEITFKTPVQLNAFTDTIIIEFDDDVTVPPVIDSSTVTISTDRFTNATSPNTGSLVNSPLDVTVQLVGTPKDEPLITLTIPDMDPTTANASLNSIAAGATVIVTFRQTTGLVNPTEAKDDTGTFKVWVSTSKQSKQVSGSYLIPRTIQLSSDDGERGKTITVTGKGFENGTTATIWRDANEDGVRDATEIDLASALIGSDNVFVVTFTMANPPFVVGKGDPDNSPPDSNVINAIDGEDNTIKPAAAAGYKGSFSNNAFPCAASDSCLTQFDLQGGVTITPTTAAIGDTIQVKLEDFPPNVLVSNFSRHEIGTKTINPSPTSATTDANGEVTFDFDIPNGLPTGTITLTFKACAGVGTPDTDCTGSSSTETKDMTITGAVITITPETVVPNQTVTLIGRGFSKISKINDTNDASVISISGSTSDLKASSGARTDKFNENAKVDTDNGGNWSAALVIPVNSTTTTTGTHQLKIKDADGREGVVDLVIVERTLILDPVESRVGSIIQVRGTGYPADNTKTGADSTVSVSIKYTASGTAKSVLTLSPDAAGNIAGSFKVPLDAGIPSTNSVRAEFTFGTTTVTTSSTHRVPRADLVIDPNSGPSGTEVTVSGTGFKAFSSLTTLEIGDIDVRPSPIPSTDSDGNFSATILVPQLNTGAQSVTGKVANTTASASFTVTAADATPTAAPASAEQDTSTAFASVIDNDIDGQPNLIGVFQFDNATQTWTSFDPDPDFADFNDLTSVSGGNIVWIRVRNAQDFNGIALAKNWNQIVLP